jgi:hypothetical protein
MHQIFATQKRRRKRYCVCFIFNASLKMKDKNNDDYGDDNDDGFNCNEGDEAILTLSVLTLYSLQLLTNFCAHILYT